MSEPKQFPMGVATVNIYESRVTDDGLGTRSVRIATEDVELVCTVDVDKLLMMLGRKAAESRRGVSQLGHGAVKVKVVSRSNRRAV